MGVVKNHKFYRTHGIGDLIVTCASADSRNRKEEVPIRSRKKTMGRGNGGSADDCGRGLLHKVGVKLARNTMCSFRLLNR